MASHAVREVYHAVGVVAAPRTCNAVARLCERDRRLFGVEVVACDRGAGHPLHHACDLPSPYDPSIVYVLTWE